MTRESRDPAVCVDPQAPPLPRDLTLHTLALSSDRRRDRGVIQGWLRATLAGICGDDPAALVFAEGAAGKPYLLDPSGAPRWPSFNLSHSGSLAVLAVSARGRQLGVDIEIPRPGRDLRQLAAGFLSEDERNGLAAVSAAHVQSWLLRRWSAKEALAKAWGLGLSAGLARIAVRDGPPVTWAVGAGLHPPAGHWCLSELVVAGGVGWVAWDSQSPN